jgi:hypothetical protein
MRGKQSSEITSEYKKTSECTLARLIVQCSITLSYAHTRSKLLFDYTLALQPFDHALYVSWLRLHQRLNQTRA